MQYEYAQVSKYRFNGMAQGEEVIIARDNKALVKLVPIEEKPKNREPGTGKGQILFVADNFDAPFDEFKEN